MIKKIKNFVVIAFHLQRRDAAVREAVQERGADVQLQGLRRRPHLRPLRRVLQELGTQEPQVCAAWSK